MPVPDGFFLNEDDIPFEEELLRNPFTLRGWLRYLQHKDGAPPSIRFPVFERAVKELPGSYKLWKQYLDERRALAIQYPITDPIYEQTNQAYERSLVLLNKMPRIWLDYCDFLVQQRLLTRARRAFDRALRALPITQHDRIWEPYLLFVQASCPPETAVRVQRRYLKLRPERVEDFIDFLVRVKRYDEAARLLAGVVNDDKFQSQHGKTQHQLWLELTDLCARHPQHIRSINVDRIVRAGIRRFREQLGRLWTSLALYYTRLGQFDTARDVYEEAMTSVTTARDFSQIFDAYAEFEEMLITVKMEEAEKGVPGADAQLTWLMARFEHLMDRRPFLLNEVLLRQNPNNVHEWLKRARLYATMPKADPARVAAVFNQALEAVDPKNATGQYGHLWISYALYYENGCTMPERQQVEEVSGDGAAAYPRARDGGDSGDDDTPSGSKRKRAGDDEGGKLAKAKVAPDLVKARAVFERAVKAPFRRVDELAAVWCAYAEMEIRQGQPQRARQLMARATTPVKKNVSFYDESEQVQMRVHKSARLWSFYADLEESLGTMESTKAVYDRILELKIATPQMIMNYALFLEDNNYFEEAFKVYERGVEVFKYPIAFEIWNTYLSKFIKRYGGTKLERLRDLFEQALAGCPAELCKPIYLMYAKIEEDHGLARHAMKIYERAAAAVPPSERLHMYTLYIQRAAQIFGSTATRPIYERAIEALPPKGAREMCLRFAELERKLGEIERARAIYSHGAQYCDPRVDAEYWQTWHDFEVDHGNEDTYREMLRIKRSIQAHYNSQVNLTTAQLIAAKSTAPSTVTPEGQIHHMAVLEAAAVPATRGAVPFVPSSDSKAKPAVNMDEIELGDEEEEEEAQESGSGSDMDDDVDDEKRPKQPEVRVEQKSVPDSVFGGLRK